MEIYIQQQNKREQRAGIALLLATATLWSFAGVLIKVIHWNPLAIAGIRSLIALPVICLAARRYGPIAWSPSHLLGGLIYSAAVISFVVATKMTTAANAILLQYTAPIYVALFSSILVKERTTPWDWLSIFAALLEVWLSFSSTDSPLRECGETLSPCSALLLLP